MVGAPGCTSRDSLGHSASTDASVDTPVETSGEPAAEASVEAPVDASVEASPEASTEAGPVLRPLAGPASYPNAFRDVLGKSEEEITSKIDGAYGKLFGSDTTTAIYEAVAGDQARINDTLHDDVRTEGIGYGMMITVQLNKRVEFDKLWRYAKTVHQNSSGSTRGYFMSSCDPADGGVPSPCVDPFGLQQFVMALLFARDRWGDTGAHNYTNDVLSLFSLMRHAEDEDGGAWSGVPNTFEPETKLVYDFPTDTTKKYTRPAVEMPAYYELWAQATGDPFWADAAAAARSYWKVTANPNTGLMPARAQFTGTPVPTWDTFRPEGYRTQINIVLDQIWGGKETWETAEDDRLLAFFVSQGLTTYGKEYSLDGTQCLQTAHEASLVAVNGITALGASPSQNQRAAFIQAVWDLAVPTGDARYYGGMLQLLALLILSGQFRVL